MQNQSKEGKERYRNRGISLPRLRELRQRRGLSQKNLGQLAGVSPGTVHRDTSFMLERETPKRSATSFLGMPLSTAASALNLRSFE